MPSKYDDDDASQQIEIPYFQPDTMPDGCSSLVCGMTGSGKSVVSKNILRWKVDLPRGICACTTEGINGFWSKFVPGPLLYYEPDPTLITKLMDMQMELPRNEEGDGPKDGAFAIFDDCLQNKYFMNSEEMDKLLLTGRHYKIFSVLTAQYIMNVRKVLRQNFNYIFLLPTQSRREIKNYYEEVGTIFPSWKSFLKTFLQIADQGGTMVIHQSARKDHLPTQVTWYKPQLDLEYKLGSKIFWLYTPIEDNEDVNHMKQRQAKDDDIRIILKPPPGSPQPKGKRRKKKKKKTESEEEREEDDVKEYYVRRKENETPNSKLYEKHFLKESKQRNQLL